MDLESFLASNPLDVDAIVNNEGDEFLANLSGQAAADAVGGENLYAQNQSLAGDGVWFNENFPKGTTLTPAQVDNELARVIAQQEQIEPRVVNPDEFLRVPITDGYGNQVTDNSGNLIFSDNLRKDAVNVNDPGNAYFGLTPAQIEQLGEADPTDPYIRARLGIPQLPGSPLTSLPSTSNFFNSAQPVATAATGIVQRSISALTPNAAAPAQDPFNLRTLTNAETAALERNIDSAFINRFAPAVSPDIDPAAEVTTTIEREAAQVFGANPDAAAEARASGQVARGRELAQEQAVLAAQKRMVNTSDWRVRLQLAPGAQYLYNAPTGPNGGGPGILWPLKQTDGVIFPYTPKIMMNYKADYEATPLTHSNYKGYFYKSSSIDQVSLNATFTAQDTSEAQYLLAVIHFFRSVTKMFYGQDPTRGAPPPLVYLTGLGEWQFSQHPCAVASFNYNLPSDVDYIRARSTNVNGTNLLTRRDRQSLPTNPISGAVGRLQNLFSSQGINKGAVFYPPPVPNLGQNQPTYVPTKIEIELTLYPMQSRQQVSKVFDNRQYNNGAQLKGGFW